MSYFSRLFCAVALALALLAASVDAHAWLSNPAPRGQYVSPKIRADLEYAPTPGDTPDAPEFVCRNDPEMPKASWLPLTAGKSQSITLEFNAKHPGDCFVYLTYDGDKPTNQMKWFKIWEQHECYKQNNYNVPIPSYLPTGEHVIFRWEWYALHVHPTIEYYAQCVDATMTGSASGALPQPQVNIPGHLPKTGGNIMDNTNVYWWPFDNQPMFFTGPAVATLNGQSNPTNSPVTTKPTEKATSAPTTKPTEKATSAPTTKPTEKATSAPTTKPTEKATSAPTTKPTEKATSAPTIKPTEKATSAPTTRPSVAPTTRPTNPVTDSAKLTVFPSSSVWWFATSISGAKASEITKIEIKDSGAVSSFKQMSFGWGDVYTFEAGQYGPLVAPLTVKASLASGSSVTFTVNSISAGAIVDSGSAFA